MTSSPVGISASSAASERQRVRGGGKQPALDLFDRVEQQDLVSELLGEAATAEVPAVELLQEAGCAPLPELPQGLADEQHQLGDDLLARRLPVIAVDHLAQRPGIALRTAGHHHRRGARRGKHRLRAGARGDVAGGDHRYVDAVDELRRERMIRRAGVHLLGGARVQGERGCACLHQTRADLEAARSSRPVARAAS